MGRRGKGRRGVRKGRGGGRRGGVPALPVLGLLVLALGCGAAVMHYTGREKEPASAVPAGDPVPTPTPTAKKTARPTAARTESPTPSPEPKKTSVPQSGLGTFTTAHATGEPVGSGGVLRRYRVQVEDGVDVSADHAAEEIQRILAHPRGWAAHGRGRFQLVDEQADFIIRIATPDTADKLCAAGGMNTHGELNCETTSGVVVNLKRWMLGSPTFAGPPSEYRHLIINHEVGHEIGIRRHLGCPGPGKAAPVMMQQIKGLNGCHSNAYPYDEEGIYIEGPLVS